MAKSPRTKSLSIKPPRFADQARVVLPGSEKASAPNAVPRKATSAQSLVTVSVIVINAMWMWNDFLLPLLILSGAKKSMTLQLAAYNFFGQYKVEWQNAMAGVLLTITPAIIFYLILQRRIIKGMVAGAVKG